MTNALAALKKIPIRLAQADVIFWLMPALIVLLIAGTMSQRWLGLYQSTEIFFSSFVIWARPLALIAPDLPLTIPLPGGYTLLTILATCLSFKFLLKSDWSIKKSGIILSHLGALILLIGGLITAIAAEERFMVIAEGGETPFIYHYLDRNLMIYENKDSADTMGREIARLPYADIKHWQTALTTANLPFAIDIIHSCDNCEITKREDSPDYAPDQAYGGMAQFMALSPKPSEKEPEANLSGFEFTLTGTNTDEHYLAFDGMPKPITFTASINGATKHYSMIFGKDQKQLPFAIRLNDFVKHDYAGTQMAQSYHSDITVIDGDLNWDTRIEMNKPLRYRGYTFFQSSFDQSDAGELTILSVVKNEGWLFPYIGTIILGLGLLLHIGITFQSRKRPS